MRGMLVITYNTSFEEVNSDEDFDKIEVLSSTIENSDEFFLAPISNLTDDEYEELERKERERKRIARVVAVVSGILFLVSVALVTVSLYLSKDIDELGTPGTGPNVTLDENIVTNIEVVDLDIFRYIASESQSYLTNLCSKGGSRMTTQFVIPTKCFENTNTECLVTLTFQLPTQQSIRDVDHDVMKTSPHLHVLLTFLQVT